jgi:5-methylcytosine-specific restriction endonuclease McrA
MSTERAHIVPTHPRVAALERLGDEIAELSAHLDAATARLLALIREFDERAGWNTGFRSCAHWLAGRVGLDLGAARERVRVARALGALPRLTAALAHGELSYSKVRALTRVATPDTEARLLAVGRAGTVSHVERIVRGWRRVDRLAEARETAQRYRGGGLTLHYDDDGMLVLHGRLTPEVGALLRQALAAARDTLFRRARPDAPVTPPTEPSGVTSSQAQQQADALALVAEAALQQGFGTDPAAERYQVVLHADGAGQAVLDDGPHVSAETSERLTCDATRTWIRHDSEGRAVEVGSRARTIPSALRRALEHRDRGCRFPGCGVRHGQGHHIRHWSHGGPTTLSNLVMLCRRHHRAVHEEGYQVARDTDGALRFQGPSGLALPEVPPPVLMLEDAVEAIRRRNGDDGLAINARTARPSWSGERLDLGWAIDALHPRANPPAA